MISNVNLNTAARFNQNVNTLPDEKNREDVYPVITEQVSKNEAEPNAVVDVFSVNF